MTPTSPLLTDHLSENRTIDSSRRQSIPRKPVPGTKAQSQSNGGDDDQSLGRAISDSWSNAWRPTSAPSFGQDRAVDDTHSIKYENLNRPPDHDGTMEGRLRHITLVSLFLVLPLCGITAALLIITYKNLLPSSNVNDSSPCSGLLVDYGASQLTSLSTWISTVATLLAPAFMALLSYPIAKVMARESHSTEKLPSPYQTSLLIELLGGSMVSLWGSFTYMLSRRRAKVSGLVHVGFIGLLFAILLGIFMQLADFWLHRATHSIIYKVSNSVVEAQYGRQLSQYCQNYYATDAGSRYECLETSRAPGDQTNPPCSVSCGNAAFFPTHFAQGYLLANSMPTNNSLEVISGTNSLSKSDSVVMLMPSNVNSNITWNAKTVGVSTHCEYINKECTRSSDGSHIWFTCEGDVPPAGFNSSGPIPFSNQNGDTSETGASLWLNTLYTQPSDVTLSGKIGNPWMFGLGMNIDVDVDVNLQTSNIFTGGGHVGTFMMCNSTTYDIEYSVGSADRNANSSSTAYSSVNINALTPSNDNVHNTVQGHIPFARSANSQQYIQNAFLSAIFSSTTDEQVLRRFEEEFGKVAMSFAAPSFEGQATTSRNNIEQRVVSCVQRAPLWSLIGLVLLYIILAVVLATIAMVSSTNNNVRSAQSQLSVAGLAAAAFEEKRLQSQHGEVKRTEDLFEELGYRGVGQDAEIGEKRKRETKRVGFAVNEIGHYAYSLTAAEMHRPAARHDEFADTAYRGANSNGHRDLDTQ